jgi:hypothetical protein
MSCTYIAVKIMYRFRYNNEFSLVSLYRTTFTHRLIWYFVYVGMKISCEFLLLGEPMVSLCKSFSACIVLSFSPSLGDLSNLDEHHLIMVLNYCNFAMYWCFLLHLSICFLYTHLFEIYDMIYTCILSVSVVLC